MSNDNNGNVCEICDSSTEHQTKPQTGQLTPWKVILHNDEVNTAEYVVNKVQEITKLDEDLATKCVTEAHKNGVALLLITHKEKAEFLLEKFESCKIDVTMEKA